MDFWERLEACKKDLSPAEMKVCRILEDNPAPFHYFSATRIAQDNKIPQASITRFVQRLGFNSYSDFRMSLVTSKKKDEDNAYETVSSDKKLIECVSSVRQVASEELLNHLSNIIINANHVFLCGTGNSHIQAYQLMIKLTNIQIQSSLVEPGFEVQSLRAMTSKDIVIMYSHMNPTYKQFLDALHDLPAEEKPYSVMIYSSPNHPLRKQVDLPIELPTLMTQNTISQANEFPPVLFNLFLIEHMVQILRNKNE